MSYIMSDTEKISYKYRYLHIIREHMAHIVLDMYTVVAP